jgi:predicted phage terminase large subunit-like protein
MTDTKLQAMCEILRRRAKEDLLAFILWTWWGSDRFAIGRHTRAICQRLTKAAQDYRRGISTDLVITVPFRHGKSEIAKGFCAYFLGMCADLQPSIIEACYNCDLAETFSKQIRSIISSDAYKAVFPGVNLARGSNKAKLWKIRDSNSTMRATGLVNGSATGHGASLLIVDDYLPNYATSRSRSQKEAIKNAFTNDLLTRKAPVCITLVIATQWCSDDLIGTIKAEYEEYEILSFPARCEEYPYLFPERYPAEWYDRIRKRLGPKRAAALMDCNPVPDEGGRFQPLKKVRFHDTLDGWPQTLRECRAWDLASSAKQRDSDDPDWTWGVRLGITGNARDGYEVWIRSAVCGRWEAPERNAIIRTTALNDPPSIRQHVESFGSYKDAVAELKGALKGRRIVTGIKLPGDKTVKAAPLEIPFDAGRVHVYRGGMTPETLDRWVADFSAFPDGAHDDAVDATALAYAALTEDNGSRILV